MTAISIEVTATNRLTSGDSVTFRLHGLDKIPGNSDLNKNNANASHDLSPLTVRNAH